MVIQTIEINFNVVFLIRNGCYASKLKIRFTLVLTFVINNLVEFAFDDSSSFVDTIPIPLFLVCKNILSFKMAPVFKTSRGKAE